MRCCTLLYFTVVILLVIVNIRMSGARTDRYDLGNIKTVDDAFSELGQPINTQTSPLPPGYMPLICDSFAQAVLHKRLIWNKDREYITIEFERGSGEIVTVAVQKKPRASRHPSIVVERISYFRR